MYSRLPHQENPTEHSKAATSAAIREECRAQLFGCPASFEDTLAGELHSLQVASVYYK